MRTLDVCAAVLLVIAGMNWGLLGLAGLNPIAAVLGGDAGPVTRLAYAAMGSAGLYQALCLRSIQQRWNVAFGPA